jgi:hypothetical protein
LRTYDAPGLCGAGAACSYPSTDVPCANGCTDGACVIADAGPPDVVSPPPDGGSCVMNCPFAAEYKTITTPAPPVSQVSVDVQIFNNTAAQQDLGKITYRYWFLAQGDPPLVFGCDFATINCSNVIATFVTMAKPTAMADTYLEVSFATGAGMLMSGATTGPIEGRIHDPRYGVLNTPANDYSYSALDTMYTQSITITVYQDKVLVWGVEPQ